jgi:hypothetical protein
MKREKKKIIIKLQHSFQTKKEVQEEKFILEFSFFPIIATAAAVSCHCMCVYTSQCSRFEKRDKFSLTKKQCEPKSIFYI